MRKNYAAGVKTWLASNFEGAEKGRVKPIEGARGFAIFLVFVVHLHEFLLPFASASGWIPQVTGFIYTVGNLAGDFFLVLTGYFIYGSLLARPTSYFQFLARQLTRIYPVFLCVLSLYLLLSVLFPTHSKLPADGGSARLYVLENLALLPGLLPIRPIISVSWTLSFVVFFYLTMPLVIAFSGMRSWSGRKRAAFFGMFLVISSFLFIDTGILPLRLNMLMVGVLLSELMARSPLPLWTGWVLASLVPVGIALRYWLVLSRHETVFEVGRAPDQTCITAICLFCFCYCLLTPGVPFGALFSWTPLRWFGNMSYSYYLSHSLTIKFLSIAAIPLISTVVRSDVGFWAIQPVLFVLSLVPGVALFVLVEKRSRGWYERRSSLPVGLVRGLGSVKVFRLVDNV